MVYILRTTEFSDFVHRPMLKKNTAFRKLGLFPTSDGGRDAYSVRSADKAYFNHWTDSG
jgi:hypothetical protein